MTSEVKELDDLISRREAIEEICKACSIEEDYHKRVGYPETSTWCAELVALRALPPAQPKIGRWILGICDNCGYKWGKDAPIANVPNYCPNCGERKRG